MKKFLLVILGAFLFSFTYAVNVEFLPTYSDARFQPSTAFHAGCTNTLDIIFSSDSQNAITALNAILEYDTKSLTILGITATDEKKLNLTYAIQDGKITLNKLKSDTAGGVSKVQFTISFKSLSTTTTSIFRFVQGSYFVDSLGKMIALDGEYTFSFGPVPECEPDIVPPTMELVYPNEKKNELPLDSYFTFTLKDEGKGINKDSLTVVIDDITYSADTFDFTWKDDQVTFLPNFWLPLDSDVDVVVKIEDKQVYGGSNITEKKYTFHTASGLSLLNNIDLNDFRLLVGMGRAGHGTAKECALLHDIYSYTQSSYQKNVASIGKRIHCDEFDSGYFTADILPILKAKNLFFSLDEKECVITVFSFIGWTLFFISFFLKLFYAHVYRKHKRIIKRNGLS